jgi:YHS domain-containing protein
MGIEVKDHLERDNDDECGYCGQSFGPDEVVIERTVHGKKYRFCSEECLKDFNDASNFKDEDLDSKEVVPPDSEDAYAEDKEEEF